MCESQWAIFFGFSTVYFQDDAIPVIRLRKVETFLGDSQHELGPYRHVADRWYVTVRQRVGAKHQGDAIPGLHIRKNFVDP